MKLNIYEEASRCLLCEDAPCTRACGKGDPARAIRADGTRYIQPATAADYCDRTWDFPYKIDHDDLCFRLFTAAGFEWGGDWTSCKDYQHFELIEE